MIQLTTRTPKSDGRAPGARAAARHARVLLAAAVLIGACSDEDTLQNPATTPPFAGAASLPPTAGTTSGTGVVGQGAAPGGSSGAAGTASAGTAAVAGSSGAAGPAAGASGTTAGASMTAGTGAAAGSGGMVAAGAGGAAGGPAMAGTGAAEPVVCPATALAPGETTTTLQVDGMARTFILHVPAGYTGEAPVPLVIDWHSLGSTGSGQKGVSGYRALSDQEGFVIAWPNGINNAWNVGPCCTTSREVDDLAFAKAVVEDIKKRACIDPKRVYADGYSMGGGMSHYLACNAADVFAAVAPSAFDLLTKTRALRARATDQRDLVSRDLRSARALHRRRVDAAEWTERHDSLPRSRGDVQEVVGAQRMHRHADGWQQRLPDVHAVHGRHGGHALYETGRQPRPRRREDRLGVFEEASDAVGTTTDHDAIDSGGQIGLSSRESGCMGGHVAARSG